MPKTKQRKNLSRKSRKKSAFCLCLANFYYGWRRANFGRRYIGNVRRFRILSYASMIALVILSIGIVMPFYIKPEDTEAATGTATESTMTFTSTRNAASVDLTVDSPDGTAVFNDSTHNVYFTIKTNNYSGYKVYLSTTNSDVSLVNGGNSIPALQNGYSVTPANFESGSSYINRWGVIPNYFNSSTNSNVRGLPTSANVDMLLRNTTSANASSAHTYTIGMAVKADFSRAPGTYTTSNLVIKYVANPVSYTINYNKNTTNTVSNMPSAQSSTTSGTTVTLSSNVPTQSGGIFAGWCKGTTTTSGGESICSGTVYQPGGAYGIDQTATNTVTLYAMWDTSGCNPAATTIGTGNTSTDAVCMQDMNDTVVSSMAIGSVGTSAQYKLRDKRDNKEYLISRLIDGKVWMTQNLDLDLSTSTTLRHSNTDLGWTTNDSTATWTPAQSTSTSAWSSSATAPRSYDGGAKYYYRSHDNTGIYTYTSLAACEAEVDDGGNPDPDCGHAHVGNYYNWRAAVASNSGTINGDAPNSICPAGWRLPTEVDIDNNVRSSEAAALWFESGYIDSPLGGREGWIDSLSYMDIERYPTYLVPAGRIIATSSPTISAGGVGGYYWAASTVSGSTTNSYSYYFDDDEPYPTSSTSRNYGQTVRCIARTSSTGTTTITFNANGGSGSMGSQTVMGGDVVELNANTYTRAGYVFVGWNTVAGGTGKSYDDEGPFYATAGTTGTVTLYAQWEKQRVTFATGTNIDLIIVAKQSGARAPVYATPGNPVTVDADSAIMVTVVPAKTSTARYQLSSWTASPATNSGSFAGNLLLTTTFTPGSEANPTWTANGTTTAADYPSIQSLSSCSSATNVTDSRNHVSYTVGPVTVSNTTYCYMLSNLRFDPRGKTLTADDSDVSSSWTVPSSSWSNHYCQARFAINSNEYYYNWYGATANSLTGVSTGTSCATQDRDNAALGSVCPAGWTLPTYATSSGTLTPAGVWNSGANPGMIMSTGTGGSSQSGKGSTGYWWAKTRYSDRNAYALYFSGSTTSRGYSGTAYYKQVAHSVRCMKK